MEQNINKRLRVLEIYSGLLTLLVVGLIVSGFAFQGKQKFKEIDVGRVNIVEPDGKLRLAISNDELAPDIIYKGKTYPSMRSGGNSAGMIFFNNEGTECGGLGFDGSEKDGKYSAGSQIAFDQYDQDQAVALTYHDENGRRSAGLRVWDRPALSLLDEMGQIDSVRKMKDGPEKTAAMGALRERMNKGEFGASRIFVGKEDPTHTAKVVLSDPQSRPRLTLSVDGSGNPKIEFLDADGKVYFTLPSK